MRSASRIDNSQLGRWWSTVDRWTLGCVGLLIGFGYVLMLAASPAVAARIGASRARFILKQVLFLFPYAPEMLQLALLLMPLLLLVADVIWSTLLHEAAR